MGTLCEDLLWGWLQGLLDEAGCLNDLLSHLPLGLMLGAAPKKYLSALVGYRGLRADPWPHRELKGVPTWGPLKYQAPGSGLTGPALGACAPGNLCPGPAVLPRTPHTHTQEGSLLCLLGAQAPSASPQESQDSSWASACSGHLVGASTLGPASNSGVLLAGHGRAEEWRGLAVREGRSKLQ